MKNSYRKYNKKNTFKFIGLFMFINLFALSLIISCTYALMKGPGNITIMLKNGEKVAFTETSITLEIDEYNRIKLPDTFESMVTVNLPSSNKVDAETYYFEDDWETNEDVYAYSFTGWQIVGTNKRIPATTVFQPGDYIDLAYIMENENSKDFFDGNSLALEAVWGRTVFMKNQYNQMVYNKYAILDESSSAATGETGASDSNLGRTVDAPVATINYAYSLFEVDSVDKDPYKNVIMLVGNLDYIKSNSTATSQPDFDKGYQSVYWGYGVEGKNNNTQATNNAKNITFKSLLTAGGNYLLKIKPYGYNANFFGSTRFDNVDVGLIKGTEITNYSSSITSISGEIVFNGADNILEFTNRFTNTRKSAFTLRTNTIRNVSVNGGYFNSWQFNWSVSNATNTLSRVWHVGPNATVGTITLGTTAPYETTKDISYGDVTLNINNATITNIYGANTGLNTKTIGDRYIKAIAANITNLYGGGHSGSLYGNIDIKVRGGNVKNLYGGGYAYTANTYGNINIDISNAMITNIYGGGYNGNVMINPSDSTYGTPGVGGNVSINMNDNTKVKGNIFGSGMGGTQTLVNATSISRAINTGSPEGWEKPANNFPKKDSSSDSINIYQYKATAWTSNSAGYVTFSTSTAKAYLSLATVENVDINISASTVEGNVYGGGSIAVVNGNTNINLLNHSVVNGSVYGGGDGVTKPSSVTLYEPMPEDGYVAPSYTVNANGSVTTQSEINTYKNYSLGSFSWSNDTALIDKDYVDIDKKLIYSPNTEGLGKVKGNTTILIEDSEIKKDVYAGGNSGMVDGTTTLNIINSNITGSAYGGCNTATVNSSTITLEGSNVLVSVYGGGNAGDVLSDTTNDVKSGTYNLIYGGGNNGNVIGNCNININSGTIDTVFGGGNLGTVRGNTNLVVGNSENNFVTISNILYGGGRGSSSDFETVAGTATVLIEGLNTHVENYGSSKLGKVVGNVDVTFKDYWTGNTTNKYNVMNGIDRATNVYFDNSYVLLENKDENGNLVGIKDITNLYIPQNSGLKISAEGEIAGDFHGGGTLYLDSEVCMNIRGNIYDKTTIVLNPKLIEDMNLITGSKDYPYMRIYGEDTSGGTALYSIDSTYTIIHGTETSGAGIYYIENDVYITETTANKIINTAGKHYTDDSSTWSEEDFYIVNTGVFSTNCDIQVSYLDDGSLGNKYENVSRKIAIYTGDTIVTMPKDTNVVMVVDGELYKYRTKTDLTEIPIVDFVKMEDETINFAEVSNIRAVATLIGGNELKKSYEYKEVFRFIIDFSECQEDTLLSRGPYNLIINYYDSDEKAEVLSKSTNVIKIEEPRKYNTTITFDRDWYEQRVKMDIKMITKSEYYILFDEADKEQALVAVLTIKNKDGEYQALSDNLIVYVNNIKTTHTNGNITFKVSSGLVQEAFTKMQNIIMDMSALSEEEFLDIGNNTLSINYYTAKDNVLEKKVGCNEITFQIIKYYEYSLYGVVISENGLQGAELLNVNRSEDNSRTIQINYKGDLIEPYVEVIVQRYNGSNYVDITNSITNTKYDITGNTYNIEAIFGNELSSGRYKVIFNLYDKYGEKKTTQELNFECN